MKLRTRRARIRGAAKWAALVVCVVIAAVWLSSRWWGVQRTAETNGRWLHLALGRGVFSYNDVSLGRSLTCDAEWSFHNPAAEWGFHTPTARSWRPSLMVGPRQTLLWLPLWIPVVILVLSTAWLWWRDRRRVRAGHCAACGYDLAGLAPGVGCPECGAKPTEPLAG